MSLRMHLKRWASALALGLSLAAACTDNPPARIIYSDASGGTSTTGSGGTTSTSVTSTSAGMAGSAGAPASIPAFCLPEECAGDETCKLTDEQETEVSHCMECLPSSCKESDDCELDALGQALYEQCLRYMVYCPEQPADVMMQRDSGGTIAAGPLAISTPTRPQLTQEEADEVYAIGQYFRAGGIYTVSYTGSGFGAAGAAGAFGMAGTGGEGGAGEPLGQRMLDYASVDNWNPTLEIEDVNKIVPGIVVDPNGDGNEAKGRFKILGRAITAAGLVVRTIEGQAQAEACPRVFVKITPGTYQGKVVVPAKTSAPPLTLYTTESDPSTTLFVDGYSIAQDDVPSRQVSATFTNSLPSGFQARNFTIKNDYEEGSVNPERDQTAVALLNQGDKALFDNVRIIGNISPAYIKATGRDEAARAYFRDCYIEGDEDIVLGRGTVVFDRCQIHSTGERVSTGSITAASTIVDNPYGMMFINTEFTADPGVSDVYLGRAWFEGDIQEAVGKVIIRNSILGAHIRMLDPWAPTQRITPQNPTLEARVLYTSDDYYVSDYGLIPPEVFLAEFGNSGPAAAE